MTITLPSRPKGKEKPNAQPARPRTREAKVPRPAAVAGVLTGASVLHAQPWSLATIWAAHTAAARYYTTPVLRWARFGYGAAHTWLIAPPLYLLVWSTDSLPKLIASAAVVTALLWLLHVI